MSTRSNSSRPDRDLPRDLPHDLPRDLPGGSRHGLVLVLGATGKTGSRVAARLAALGVPVRAGSRCAAVPFDWTEPATWGPAVDGASAVYLSFQPDLAVPGAADAVGGFARVAVAAGARRIVLLSGRGENGALAAEEAVRRSGAEVTVVRCGWFAQNFDEGYLVDAVRSGRVLLPAGDVAEPFVDAADVADVAVAALTAPGHGGRVYELTGPRLLTFADVAAELSRATGREVAYTPVTGADFAAALTAQRVPGEVVELLTYLFAEVLDGRNASVADGVRQALGRPARDFADYARSAAATGVWDMSARGPASG